jgi:hypothetical protein
MTTTDTPKKPGRGGKRPGAGRPRKVWSTCPPCPYCAAWRAALAHAAFTSAA